MRLTRTLLPWLAAACCAAGAAAVGPAQAQLQPLAAPQAGSRNDLSDPAKKDIAMQLVSSAENSSLDWRAQYRYIEDIGDGRGYTAGIVGFCSGTGDMLQLVETYNRRAPGNVLAKYLPALRRVDGSDSHEGLDPNFVSDWRRAAQDPAFRQSQDAVRDEVYFNPAVQQAKQDGLRALGQFIYYDALVMHGPGSDSVSFGGIRKKALRRAKPPSQGGDEVAYLNAFLDARVAAMKTEEAHSDTSRVDTAQRVFLRKGNLDLNTPLEWKVYGDSYRIAAVDGNPPPAPPPPTAPGLDDDGVQMLLPSATKGTSLRLGENDPNQTSRIYLEKKQKAYARDEGALRYWSTESYPLNYASGGTGWTMRLHFKASDEEQRYTWKTQKKGYLASPKDFRNQEFTVYLRVHQLLDAGRSQAQLKVRGGRHSGSDPDAASCVMMTLGPADSSRNARFAKELTHPDYDYVRLEPKFDAGLVDNTWVGLKLVSYADPSNRSRVINRLYLDRDPFDRATGKPNNRWRLFSEYVDVDGTDTGHFSKYAHWGGPLTTLRVDGWQRIDFALPSVREIVPPAP
ncbi:chitosanase [Caldimonas brevitalea]|uniref:Chitosanase n=1 Tax=Caldimonas brevitalea TaxID=413882 RepID=A0A0G3BJR7_9BURK|nr:chitosanase [Caldimonas brevitalea]AKJ29632.1 chitosanase [Caldimonas brevitalea]